MQDFEKGNIQRFAKSLSHYDSLADRLNRCSHSLDVFACSLDQVGLAEMHPAVHYTGEPFPLALLSYPLALLQICAPKPWAAL